MYVLHLVCIISNPLSLNEITSQILWCTWKPIQKVVKCEYENQCMNALIYLKVEC